MNIKITSFIDPLLVAIAFCLAIGEASILSLCLEKMGGVFAKSVTPGEKTASIEGLRGILAFSVVVHHGCCWYFYNRFGVWQTGQSIVFARLASFGVVQFFYISGYLFWRKLRRRGGIRLGRFYLSRIIRIAPAYHASVASAIIIGLSVVGFKLHTTINVLLRSVGSWFLFCLGGLPSVNGADTTRIIAGVTWTIADEWGFYLLLPFLGWFSRRKRRLICFAFVFGCMFAGAKHLCGTTAHIPQLLVAMETIRQICKFMLIGFGGGILVATFEPNLRGFIRLSANQASWLLLSFYLLYLLMPDTDGAGQLLLLCGFTLVVHGANLFGLMTSRGVRLLGITSYPLYLVHGIIYYLATRLRGGIHPVPIAMYLPETILCMAVAILVATMVHFAIERPTMLISERIAHGKREQVETSRSVVA